LKRAFGSSTIKPTNLNRIMEKTEPIDVVIQKFVYNPGYDTQLNIYSTCYSYSRTESTKIMLSSDLYDSFKSAIDKYGKNPAQRILTGPFIAVPTIIGIAAACPIDTFSFLWFIGCLMAEYEYMAFLGRSDAEIYHRQQFLQDFLNNKIEKRSTSSEIKDTR